MTKNINRKISKELKRNINFWTTIIISLILLIGINLITEKNIKLINNHIDSLQVKIWLLVVFVVFIILEVERVIKSRWDFYMLMKKFFCPETPTFITRLSTNL